MPAERRDRAGRRGGVHQPRHHARQQRAQEPGPPHRHPALQRAHRRGQDGAHQGGWVGGRCRGGWLVGWSIVVGWRGGGGWVGGEAGREGPRSLRTTPPAPAPPRCCCWPPCSQPPFTCLALSSPPVPPQRLADHYFGSEGSMIRLDMSEYMERHTVGACMQQQQPSPAPHATRARAQGPLLCCPRARQRWRRQPGHPWCNQQRRRAAPPVVRNTCTLQPRPYLARAGRQAHWRAPWLRGLRRGRQADRGGQVS